MLLLFSDCPSMFLVIAERGEKQENMKNFPGMRH